MDELLAAIVAARDDDAPRRVYADKLLEAGEPQGELIHIQCDLAAGGLAREGAVQRRLRERELLAAHAARWTAGLTGLVEEAHFARGFVDEVCVSAETWTARGDDLFAAAPALRAVVWAGLHVRSADVGGPDAARNYITTTFVRALASPNIQRLVGLGHNGFSFEHRFYQFEDFDESHNIDDDDGMGRLLAADIGHLRALSISSIPSNAGAAALARAPLLRRLERLRVGYCASDTAIVDAVDPAVIASLSLNEPPAQLVRLGNLRELSIRSARTTPLPLPPRLERLAVQWKYRDEVSSLPALLARPELAGLVELQVFAEELSETAFAHVRLPALRSLRLCGTHGIGASQARALLRGPLGAQLEVLEIPSVDDQKRDKLERDFGVFIDVRPRAATVYWR